MTPPLLPVMPLRLLSPLSYRKRPSDSIPLWKIPAMPILVRHGPSLHTACRAPGVDANPHLTFGALLAAGLKGSVRQDEPPQMFTGNPYAAQDLHRCRAP